MRGLGHLNLDPNLFYRFSTCKFRLKLTREWSSSPEGTTVMDSIGNYYGDSVLHPVPTTSKTKKYIHHSLPRGWSSVSKTEPEGKGLGLGFRVF